MIARSDQNPLRISVVTPSYNLGLYLEETIRSVLANLSEGDEYFVIDGGSSDGSLDVIRKYETHLTGWVSERDDGYADALAKGFARASGDILCWINAGDLYLTGAFEAARRLFADDTDLIFGDDFYLDEDSRVISHSRGWVPDLRTAMLYGTWTPLQDACFWRRRLYVRVDGIDPSLKYAADYDLFLRMALNGRAAYVPTTFSAFRRHAGQKSRAGARAYQNERMRVRSRELQTVRLPGPVKSVYGGINRAAMSLRSRIIPFLGRTDVAGKNIGDLHAGCYIGAAGVA